MVKSMAACVNKLAYTSSSGGKICLTSKVLENMGEKCSTLKRRGRAGAGGYSLTVEVRI